MFEPWLASFWPERDVGGSVELGSSFGVVCTFHLHSICSIGTTGWHFVSYTAIIIDRELSKWPNQFRDKTSNIQRIVNVT